MFFVFLAFQFFTWLRGSYSSYHVMSVASVVSWNVRSPLTSFAPTQVETYMRSMATALFGVLATVGGVPIIRALPGGPTQMISELLSKVRSAVPAMSMSSVLPVVPSVHAVA